MTTDTSPSFSKPCMDCGVSKPHAEFYPHPSMAAGTLNRCKPCFRRAAQATRARNREYYLQFDRARYVRSKDQRVAILRSGVAKHPERKRARMALQNAVRRGDVLKPEFCDDCGQQFARAAIHGHHEDYTRPLDVAWVCARCHGKRHRMEAA